MTTQAVDVSHYAYRVTWSGEDDEFAATCAEPRFHGWQIRRRQRSKGWLTWSLKRWTTSPWAASPFPSPCQHEPTQLFGAGAFLGRGKCARMWGLEPPAE